MKNQLLVPILVAATIIAVPSVSQSQPKGKVRYFCKVSNSIPITFARTPTETVEFIGWQSKAFSTSGYPPERRCQEVATRFQKHSDAGHLRFITTGKMNNQNVMCVAHSKGGGCRSDGLLLTFEPKDDPQTVFVELFNVSTRVRKVRLTRGKPIYIDVDEYLSNASGMRQSQPTKPENQTLPKDDCGSSFFCNN